MVKSQHQMSAIVGLMYYQQNIKKDIEKNKLLLWKLYSFSMNTSHAQKISFDMMMTLVNNFARNRIIREKNKKYEYQTF